jgi:osmotically-inducible protein OsmY
MNNDNLIQKEVIAQLHNNPAIIASEIGVAVKNGVVTLSGIVDDESIRTSAEKSAHHVAGVKAVAVEIMVGTSTDIRNTDTEIAAKVFNALTCHSGVPEQHIKIIVEDGNVTLEGEVDRDLQRLNAKAAVEGLPGVRSVNNLLTIKQAATCTDVQAKIRAAFIQSATVAASNINAEVIGNKVILSGTVCSCVEKDNAEKAAWSYPGVAVVENKLKIAECAY